MIRADLSPAPDGPSGAAPRPSRAARAATLAWPAALAAVVAAPFVTVLAGVHTLVVRDTAQIHFPLRSLVSEAVRAGRLPLWNPHEGLGKPLLADGLHGVLHPLSLLAAAVDPGGVDLLAVLYVVSAALGAYVLARELELPRPAAFAAGAAYGLSGYVVSMTSALVFLAGASSLPWQVAALAACGRGARLAGPLAAAATAIGLATGDGQMVSVGVLLGAAIAIERRGARALLPVVAATALGAALGAVQLVPTVVQALRSTRAGGVSEFEHRMWALSPWRLLELATPGLLYRLPDDASAGAFEWLDRGGAYLPFGATVFVGIPTLALAAAAPLGARPVRVLAAAAAAFLWLALGWHAGAHHLLSALPVWRSFRYTEKFVVPLALALALLAAHGLRGRGGAGPDRRRIALAAVVAGSLPLAAWLVATFAPGVLRPPDGPEGDALRALRGNLAAGLAVALPGAGLLGGALLLRRRALADGAIAAAVAAALLLAVPFARHLGDPRALAPSQLAALPAPPPGPRITVPSYRIPAPARGGLDDSDQRNRVLGALGVASWNVLARVDAFESYGPFEASRWSAVAAPIAPLRGALFRRFAGTHVILQAPARLDGEGPQAPYVAGARLAGDDRSIPLFAYAVPHRPWALFAPAAVTADGPDAALARLRENVAAGSDEVVVEAPAAPPNAPGTVLSVRRGAEELALDVRAEGDGLLVVNDAWWPGWIARVDGRPAPILPVDVLVRGVVVPAGRHAVTMSYEPPELRWGLAASGAALAVLAAWLAVAARRARPSSPRAGYVPAD